MVPEAEEKSECGKREWEHEYIVINACSEENNAGEDGDDAKEEERHKPFPWGGEEEEGDP